MRSALAAAVNAGDEGDVPVGAVIVNAAGDIIATAANRMEKDADPTAHAEILAISQACKRAGSQRLSGCVLVVTLEPCLMCAGAISHARLAGLVFGAVDRLCGAIVSRVDYYDLPGARRNLWHLGGILSSECSSLLSDFFRTKRIPPA